MTKEILDQYFDLEIPKGSLLAKGEAIEGEHGITELDGEFFVSGHHIIKNGVAKTEMKMVIDEFIALERRKNPSNKHPLSALAKSENNQDYNSWPKVVYSDNPEWRITKIKLSWLVEHFMYSSGMSFNRERDIIKTYIGEDVALEFEKTIKTKKGVTSRAKFNAIRVVLEALFNAMNQEELLPDVFVKPVSFGPIVRYFRGEVAKGYQIDRLSKLPEIPSRALDFLILIGHKGSHYDDKFLEYTKKHNDKYLVNACVFMLLDLLMWYKDYIDSSPNKKKWTRVDVIQVEGRVKIILMDGRGFLKPNSNSKEVHLSQRLVADHQLKEGDLIIVNAIDEGRRNLEATDIVKLG